MKKKRTLGKTQSRVASLTSSLALLAAVAMTPTASVMAAEPRLVEPGETVYFVEGDDLDVDESDCSGGNVCIAEVIRSEAKITVQTFFAAGAFETKHAQGTLINEFQVSGSSDTERFVGSSLSGKVAWAGRFYITGGVGDTEASVKIVVRLRDVTENRIVAEQTLLEQECDAVLDVLELTFGCLKYPQGSRTFNMSVDLLRGHSYAFDLVARCESSIDVVAASVLCAFDNVWNEHDGITRGPIELHINRDLEQEIDELKEELEQLKYKFLRHQHTYLTGRGKGHNDAPADTTPPRQ